MKLINLGQKIHRNATSNIHKKSLYDPFLYQCKYYWDESIESKDCCAAAIEEHVTDQIDYYFHVIVELFDEA